MGGKRRRLVIINDDCIYNGDWGVEISYNIVGRGGGGKEMQEMVSNHKI